MTSVIFDIGGVLVHDLWEPLCFGPGGIAETYNLPMEQFREYADNLNIEYARSPIEKTGPWEVAEHACWSRIIEEFSAYFPGSIIPEDLILMTDDFIHPLNQEDIVAIVHTLAAKGIPMGVCSDMSSFLYARIAAKLRLVELFDPKHIIVSYNIGALKMDGSQMFAAVTRALGTEPEQCIFFDDRPINIQKAHEFGIESILVPASVRETSVAIRSHLVQKGII